MTPVLSQIVSYFPLEEDDKFKGRYISSIMEYTSNPLIEDVSYSNEDIDHIEETLIDRDME